MWTTRPRASLSPSVGARSCRGKEGKEKRNHLFRITSPTTHLGSWHPFPPTHSSIVQHSELLPIRRSPLIGALAHFRRPPISPGCTWLRGHHEGSFRSGSLWGRSFITMLNCQAPVWCHAHHCPSSAHVSVTDAGHLCRSTLYSNIGYPVHTTT